MSKYSSKFKLEVVRYCIEENHSTSEAVKKYNIASPTPIKEWIRKYKEHGAEGLVKQQKIFLYLFNINDFGVVKTIPYKMFLHQINHIVK